MKQIRNFEVALITVLAAMVSIFVLTSTNNDSPNEEPHVIYVIPEVTIIGQKANADSLFIIDESEPEPELEDWMFDMEHFKDSNEAKASQLPDLP